MEDDRPMTVRDWMITILILAIPFVNLIMYLVWAFGSDGNINRKNFCKASLIWFCIIVGISLVFGLIGALIGGGAHSGI